MATPANKLGLLEFYRGILRPKVNPTEPDPRPKQIEQAWLDGWNSGDPEALVRMFTPDGVYHDVALSLHKQGVIELRVLHRVLHGAIEELSARPLATHVTGQHGTVEWLLGGIDAGLFKTRKPFEIQCVSVLKFTNDHIVRAVTYYDLLAVLDQVQLAPVRPAIPHR